MTHALPHERAPAARIFTCWPAHAEEWPDGLAPVRADFAGFLQALTRGRTASPLTVLAANGEAEASARQAVGRFAQVIRAPYGDVWTRDTGPVFFREDGRLIAAQFRLNGWGGKFQMPGDETVAARLAAEAGAELRKVDLVAEGGALEFDGDGTVLTTRSCLLNPNRNPGLSEHEVEARLKAGLGVKKVLWLDDGLVADHTDGHIDNLARFVRPGLVLCQSPIGKDDPNAAVYGAAARQISRMRDARGRRLQLALIPSPGRVTGPDGEVRAASHLNYVFGADRIIVPTYGGAGEGPALRGLRTIFREHRIIGAPATGVLAGGGAFHCVTCHIPAEEAAA
jgi:agmatine deiminase